VTFFIKQLKRTDSCNLGRKIAWRDETYPDLIFSLALFEVFAMNVFSAQQPITRPVVLALPLPHSPPQQPISEQPNPGGIKGPIQAVALIFAVKREGTTFSP